MLLRQYIQAFAPVLATVITAGCSLSRGPEPPRPTRLFPAETVCSLPAISSIKKLNYLGSGVWKPLSEKDPSAGYACGPEMIVELASVDTGTVTIEYKAAGGVLGASLVSVNYSAVASTPLANESTYRRVYAAFANEMVQRLLQQPLPELATKKIANLASYSAPGGDPEIFDVGEGFILLGRIRKPDSSTIQISLQIFPDKTLKLKN